LETSPFLAAVLIESGNGVAVGGSTTGRSNQLGQYTGTASRHSASK
jgi:hypothetical protein